MAMTAPLLNRDATLYDSPDEYRPERFVEDPHLDRYMLTFSRGPRVCLGVSTDIFIPKFHAHIVLSLC